MAENIIIASTCDDGYLNTMSIEQTQAQLTIEGFFTRVLNGDKSVQALINESTGRIDFENDTLTFDLPSLYPLIFSQKTLSYAAFKTVLYSGDLNSRLREKGATVVLSATIDSRDNAAVDVNVYCLRLI